MTVKLEKTRHKIELTGEGHTGNAPKGENLKCAGATALFYAVKYRLEELEKEKYKVFAQETKVEIKDGYFRICAKPMKASYARVEEVFATAAAGLRAILNNE